MRKGVHSRDAVLSGEELAQMWLQVHEPLDCIIFGLQAECGMRRGEVAALKKQWVSFAKGDISIPQQDGTWTPKYPASARLIPVSMLSSRTWEAVAYYFKY